jgi:hypothetical protein
MNLDSRLEAIRDDSARITAGAEQDDLGAPAGGAELAAWMRLDSGALVDVLAELENVEARRPSWAAVRHEHLAAVHTWS